MCRIWNDIAIFFSPDRMPITFGDFTPIATADHACGTGLLLTAADPIGEAVVGVDVIHLRGRLVVPRAPRRAVIDRDRRALIARQRDDVRIVGIDPNVLIVVTTR